jgi:hypothetical protein
MSKTTIPRGGITADAIDGTLIADDAINSEHFTDGSIDTAHIADSQVTAAKTSGVGGLIRTANAYNTSSVSTLTMDGIFTSSYGIYRVIGYIIPATDASGIEMKLRNASSADFDGDSDQYRSFSAGHRITSSSDTVETFTNGDYAASHWKVNFGGESNSVDAPICFDMMFYDPLQAAVSGKNAHWRVSHVGNDAKHYYHYGSGTYTTNSGADAAGIRFTMSSGNITRHKVAVYAFIGSEAA